MAYGTETHNNSIQYKAQLNHTATGATLFMVCDFGPQGPSLATEAQRDALFQAFLTRIGGINGTTLGPAEKVGGYTTPVTSA